MDNCSLNYEEELELKNYVEKKKSYYIYSIFKSTKKTMISAFSTANL